LPNYLELPLFVFEDKKRLVHCIFRIIDLFPFKNREIDGQKKPMQGYSKKEKKR
jgi:hypothetical protein